MASLATSNGVSLLMLRVCIKIGRRNKWWVSFCLPFQATPKTCTIQRNAHTHTHTTLPEFMDFKTFWAGSKFLLWPIQPEVRHPSASPSEVLIMLVGFIEYLPSHARKLPVSLDGLNVQTPGGRVFGRTEPWSRRKRRRRKKSRMVLTSISGLVVFGEK